MSLEQRWSDTRADVARICGEYGRSPQDIRIIAVSKTVEPPVVGEAIACGVTDFGENRDKPFNEKVALYSDARWHFIGTLQSNKARHDVGKAFLIHSLDRLSLLEAMRRQRATSAASRMFSSRFRFRAKRAREEFALANFPPSSSESHNASMSHARVS